MARDITRRPGEGSVPRPASAGSWLAAEPSGTTPEDFIAALRRARQEADGLSYRSITLRAMHQGERTLGWYSHSTIWRAFTSKKVPRWGLVHYILCGLGVDDTQINTAWREMWRQARKIEALRRSGGPDAQQATAAPTARQNPGESPRRLAALTPPPIDGQPRGQECDDCGALIGDPIRHQAWHWRMERQISRAILRAIDGTGQ